MLDEHVTILVPTSPIPRHPDTSLIDECLGMIRHYFPKARLVIMGDGVRPQIEHRRGQYMEYRSRLIERGLKGEFDFDFMPESEFMHQAMMTQRELQFVKTPLVLFVEHDAILRGGPAIEWPQIFDMLLHDKVNVVRLYNFDSVPREHEYLMRGQFDYEGVNYVRTIQFSGWPLVARTEYLRRLLDENVRGRHAMIESVAYGPVVAAPWEAHKIVIYAPPNMKTFVHRDGRTDTVTGRRDPADW